MRIVYNRWFEIQLGSHLAGQQTRFACYEQIELIETVCGEEDNIAIVRHIICDTCI